MFNNEENILEEQVIQELEEFFQERGFEVEDISIYNYRKKYDFLNSNIKVHKIELFPKKENVTVRLKNNYILSADLDLKNTCFITEQWACVISDIKNHVYNLVHIDHLNNILKNIKNE